MAQQRYRDPLISASHRFLPSVLSIVAHEAARLSDYPLLQPLLEFWCRPTKDGPDEEQDDPNGRYMDPARCGGFDFF